LNVRYLAFPDHYDAPTELAKSPNSDPVASNVPIELGLPKGKIALRGIGVLAAGVPVPEAAVNKDHGTVARQDDVRPAREIATVQAKSISQPVQRRANDQLRLRVPAPDPGHVPASTFLRERIHRYGSF
jgi:hypothetical protein